MNEIVSKAQTAACLTKYLSDRLTETDGQIDVYGAGRNYLVSEGKCKTQIHNDIVVIRRLLLQIDKEVMMQ